jgi:DNA-binding PadR family transcriptional regulator
LQILLALASGELHGYAIMQEVSRQSKGHYKLGPGTLYYNLERLIGQGLVLDMGHRVEDNDSRRRYYRLSASGQAVLAAELKRLEGMIHAAELRLRELEGGRA